MTWVQLPPVPANIEAALEPEPVLSADVYLKRVRAVTEQLQARGLSHLAVYADREHPANVSYLTGFDPRFEEAVAVVSQTGAVHIITGNESMSMVPNAPIPAIGILCQSLSLPDQDRTIRARLAEALREAGVTASSRVGIVGWRSISAAEAANPLWRLALPAFVVGELYEVTSDIHNATEILTGTDGLRAHNDVDQLAVNEHRATRASRHVWNALAALRPGVSELELSVQMRLSGTPLSAHVMLTSGRNGVVGLNSPTDRVIEHADAFSTAVGLHGGLTSRAGWVLRHDELDDEQLTFARGYFAAVSEWYQSLRLGASTAEIAARVGSTLAEYSIKPALNPGHLQHIDEWLGSPFRAGSNTRIRSGMSLQADIIPVGTSPRLVSNCEDALAIADEDLRERFHESYPLAAERIAARKVRMREELGIAIADEVLPFSDRQAVFVPALLSPDHALTNN